MKFWTLAGLLAGIVATTLILRKQSLSKDPEPQPVRAPSKPDERYAVDDFMAEL
jgi:hypothetical protein